MINEGLVLTELEKMGAIEKVDLKGGIMEYMANTTPVKKPKDLGTYYLRVELEDGRGWYDTWDTHGRWVDGRLGSAPLESKYIPPYYTSADDVERSMLWQYLEGNYSCDCNKTLFYNRAYGIETDEEHVECSDNMILKRLTMIRPSGKEKVIYEND